MPRYVELLEAGGSDKPEHLFRKIGFEIGDEKFWEGGFAVIRELLFELKALVN